MIQSLVAIEWVSINVFYRSECGVALMLLVRGLLVGCVQLGASLHLQLVFQL